MNESKGMTKELTKLRISAHKLKIESCRYARPKIPRQNRLCICCNKIEDESHFLLHCMKNQSLRASLFSKFTHLNASSQEITLLKGLLNPQSKKHCSTICQFIIKSLAAM